VGLSYPPSALFAVAIGLIAMILLNFSLAVSRLSDQNKILAQRLSLLQHRLEERDDHPVPKAEAVRTDDVRHEVEREGKSSASVATEELSHSR
jgi:hypothetical protein